MSWQVYITNLTGTGSIAKAAILGQKGGIWASSAEFPIKPEEQSALIGGFNDPTSLQASGIKLGGLKYMCLQANDKSVYGRKEGTGCVCVKTQQAVVVGVYSAGTQPGAATKVVEELGDYLRSQGF